MSRARSRLRARPRDVEQPAAVPEGVGILVGWARTTEDLPDARRQTHDALIGLMGTARRGGVSWRQLEGDDAAGLLERLLADRSSGPELLSHYRVLRGMLREYGGWLVVATAPGEAPS